MTIIICDRENVSVMPVVFTFDFAPKQSYRSWRATPTSFLSSFSYFSGGILIKPIYGIVEDITGIHKNIIKSAYIAVKIEPPSDEFFT